MRLPTIVSVLAGAAAAIFALRELSRPPLPAAPVRLALADFDPSHPPAASWVTFSGGRADLVGGAIRYARDGRPSGLLFPLRPLDAPIASLAPIVALSRDPTLLALFDRGAAPVTPEALDQAAQKELTGTLVPFEDAPEETRREARKFRGSLSSRAWLLVDGEKPRGSLAAPSAGLAALFFAGAWLFARRGGAEATERERGASQVATAKRAGAISAAASSPGASVSPPPPVLVPTESASGPARPPNVPAQPETSDAGNEEPEAPTTLAASLWPGSLLPDPPEPAMRRRLFDYSSIATVSPSELPRRFRFVADKAILLDAALRVFPVVGRHFELPFGGILEIVAYRAPELVPWNELVVVELVPRRELDARTIRPVRLVPRTVLDFGPAGAPGGAPAAELLRRFAAEIASRAKGARVDEGTRAWLAGERALPPRFDALKELAKHDARLMDG